MSSHNGKYYNYKNTSKGAKKKHQNYNIDGKNQYSKTDKSIPYSNIIYSFDTEFAHTKDETGNTITFCYIASAKSIDFNMKDKTIAEMVQAQSKPHFMRDCFDIDLWLRELNRNSKKRNEITIIYCHNFQAEFEVLIHNVKWFRNAYATGQIKYEMNIKSRQPTKVRIGFIEFRCSYKLLNKSIKTLAEELGLQKGDDSGNIINYNEVWTPYSDLPIEQYQYNENDNTIALCSILRECCKWQWCKSVKDIPLTITGFTRVNNKVIAGFELQKDYEAQCKYQHKLSNEFITYLERIFAGGYTHANPLASFKIFNDVYSFDAVSMYPSQMKFRQFPVSSSFMECTRYKDVTFKRLINDNKTTYEEVIKNFVKPFKWAFLVSVQLKNVKCKKLIGDNMILPISVSKVDSLVSDCIIDNGRVLESKSLVWYGTEVDWFNICEFYDFEIDEVKTLYYTSKFAPLHEFVLKALTYYANEKSVLKHCTRVPELQKSDFWCDKSNSFIYDDETISNIINANDIAELVNILLMCSKGKLNAQYGIMVQSLLQDTVKYDIDLDMFVTEKNNGKKGTLRRDYITGIYVTAYSRLSLFTFGKYVIYHSPSLLIYSDTDSWKIKTDDVTRLLTSLDNYNKIILNAVGEDFYKFGCFDNETEQHPYSKFITIGCKRYLTLEWNNKIKDYEINLTASGISKGVSKVLDKYYVQVGKDFETVVDDCFTPNTLYTYSACKKNLSKFHSNEEYDIIVTDENGDTFRLIGRNMYEIFESDYLLCDMEVNATKEYIKNCERLQGRKVYNRDYYSVISYRDDTVYVEYTKDLSKYNLVDYASADEIELEV